MNQAGSSAAAGFYLQNFFWGGSLNNVYGGAHAEREYLASYQFCIIIIIKIHF